MALIKCTECGKEISDQAEACPICGKPVKAKVTTIELTSKKWKRIKLLAVLGIVLGLMLFMNGYNNGGVETIGVGLGGSILFVSIIFLFVGKFGAWWTNR